MRAEPCGGREAEGWPSAAAQVVGEGHHLPEGPPDAQHAFGSVVHAATREEAERVGARKAVAERGANGLLYANGLL